MANKRHRRPKEDHFDDPLVLVAQATQDVGAQYLTSPWLLDYIAQRGHWHALFMRTMEAAVPIVQRKIWPEVFNTYLILGARWFSHHEAVQMLLLTARYGDCMVLLRSLLEDSDLMPYFSCYPNRVRKKSFVS